MDTAKLFVNGRSQAVRLPKAFRFDGDEVCITKIDDLVILFPPGKGWDLLTRGIKRFTDDYLTERAQPAAEDVRDEL